MANFILIAEAAQQSSYSVPHIRWLIRENKVQGRKVGGVWLVDLDDLLRYEQHMEQLGTQKHTPGRSEEDEE